MANDPHAAKEAAGATKKPPVSPKTRTGAPPGKPAAPKNNVTKQPAGPGVKTDPPAAARPGKAAPVPDDMAMNETMNLDGVHAAPENVTMNLDPADIPPDPESATMNLDPDDIPADPEPAAKEKEPELDAEKEATMLGDFKLLKKLGQGGMGAVYKAHQVSLDRIVAIKVLSKDLVKKKEFVARFKREAMLMVKLDHPNVLRCFESKEDKGFHYIALEFIEGGSVEGWLKKLGKFSIGDAMHIVLKTLYALQHAHEKALIHRDIKPDNLLLTKAGVVKVADMGLAKDTEDDVSLTKSGAGAGTPIYMAPEQAYNVKHVDCRVDIYAVGVMIYVFLTGRAPFEGTTPIELIMAKEKGKFDPMRKHNDEVPGKLDLIVDKMLAKDPKHRYATCEEIINEIEPLGLANETLSFLESGDTKATATVKKLAATKVPAAPAAKTMQKTPTKAPASPAKTNSADTPVEKDVWYWNMVTKSGQIVPKKVTTDQLKTLIKAGHLDAEAQISKTLKSGHRAAATYMEFHSLFKSKETVTTANVKGQKYREIYKEIEAADARKRRWGWLGRMFKGTGGTIMGLVWILLILGVAGGAAWFGYTKFIAAP
jgi:eukaryotic-like serine/threonine-protein kinase